MRIKEYMEFCRSVSRYPKETEFDDLSLGLIGEIGEFANKLKKVNRDDGGKITGHKRRALILELGDALWYTIRLADVLGYELGFPGYEHFHCYRCVKVTKLPALVRLASKIASAFEPVPLLYVFADIGDHLGATLGYVAQENMAKLKGRAATGTLHGEGDHR